MSFLSYCFSHTDVPRIVMPLENTILSSDESTNGAFTCSATGIPVPTITFYIVFANGSRIPLSSISEPRLTISMPDQTDDFRLSDNRGVAPLITRTLMLAGFEDDDSGTYSCEATNGVGNTSRDVELLVRGMLIIVTINEGRNKL